jgi:hypothetical protein
MPPALFRRRRAVQGFADGEAKDKTTDMITLDQASPGQVQQDAPAAEETRTFRLCTRAARDGAVAGMAASALAGILFAAWLLFKSLARPQDLSWTDFALPAAALGVFLLLRFTTACCLTVGPAGLARGRGADRRMAPWSSVEAVEVHALPPLRACPGPEQTREPWLLIRLRGARSIAVRGEIDGFQDLMQILRRHVPPERWRDQRSSPDSPAA